MKQKITRPISIRIKYTRYVIPILLITFLSIGAIDTIFYFHSVKESSEHEKEIAAYNEVHPNVKINLELVGGGTDWRSTLKAEISSGQAPMLLVCLHQENILPSDQCSPLMHLHI